MKKITILFSLCLLTTIFYHNGLFGQDDQKLVGQEAPAFDLKNIDGNMVNLNNMLEDDAVKGAIVVFTCNHCPYSKLYEDRIVNIDKNFKRKGYPVIAINPNDPEAYPSDDFANMKVRAKEKGFTFPYLVDETQNIAKAYGATRTPHTFILHKEDGKFIVRYVGAIDDSARDEAGVEEKFVQKAIMELEGGQSVSKNYTKAIGCTIKWKDS